MSNNKNDLLEFHGGKGMSLLPLVIFALFCVLFFVVFKVFEMEALAMGGIVALMIGSFFSKNWTKYWESAVSGMSSEIMNMLALMLLVVNFFAQLMSIGGVAEGFVWLGDKVGLNGGAFVAFSFVATGIIATATGASIGTLFAAFPIFYPSGILLGADPLMLAGALLSGSIFGDNIAPVSDTVIASSVTQSFKNKHGEADVGGVVKTRISYAAISAVISLILFYLLGSAKNYDYAAGSALIEQYINSKGLIMLIPVVVVIVVAIKNGDIFVASTCGVVSGILVGLVSGVIGVSDILSVQDGALNGLLIDSVKGMLGTVVYLYAVAGIMGILKESGMMDHIIQSLLKSKFASTVVGSELIISFGVMITAVCLGAATGPAIIVFAPIADEIGKAANLHPYRRANLLDGMASSLPVNIPFTSAFIFIVISNIQGLMSEYSFIQQINPISLSYANFHSIGLFLMFFISILTGLGRDYEGPNGERVSSKQYESNIKTAIK